MGLTCTGDPHPKFRHRDKNEHPVVAIVAVVAILLAILLIAWARIEVHGTADLESALTEPRAEDVPVPQEPDQRNVDEAVTSSRFATGFSP